MRDPVILRKSLVRGLPRPAWPAGYWSRTLADYDAGTLHALLCAAHDGGPQTPGAFGPWRRAQWEAQDFDRSLCFLALDRGRRIVGAAWCRPTGAVRDLAVAPGHRRKGLAEALMLSAFREFRRRGAPAVELRTTPDNAPTLALCHKLGMRAAAPEDA